ncbi:MAG: DUF928 domain-containing protein [Rhizonema sp. PD37]|nr:DUF928 domain-containing protein [Rhizonema sp. PD37]
MFSFHKRISLFSFALIPLVITSNGVSAESISPQIPKSTHLIAQSFSGWVASLWQRRPKRKGASRSRSVATTLNVCEISPGIIDTYIVWSDRPLFLWQYSGTGEETQLIVREEESHKVVLTQPVNFTDQQFLYNGTQPLEPGKTYQWQLSGSTIWTAFQTMSASEHGKIQADLQALEQQLKANKANQEEIAQRKALYFLNYPVKHTSEEGTFNLWSDALEALYKVNKPSQSFVEKRQAFVTSMCSSEGGTNK